MEDLQNFLNQVMPLRYTSIFSIGDLEDGLVRLVGGIAAYNDDGERVWISAKAEYDHRLLNELALRLSVLQPDALTRDVMMGEWYKERASDHDVIYG